jgi:hypothetical protein
MRCTGNGRPPSRPPGHGVSGSTRDLDATVRGGSQSRIRPLLSGAAGGFECLRRPRSTRPDSCWDD